MNCLPSNLRLEDIDQWLSGGWFLFQSGDDSAPEPASLTGVDGEYGAQLMDGSRYPLKPDATFPFWPACGAVNLNGYAVYLERLQQRQYRRTYNTSCINMHLPRKWDVMKRYGTAVSALTADSEDVVRAVFSPIYYTFSQAINMLDENWVSIALNPHLIVSGRNGEYHVYYRNKLIGTVSQGRITPIGSQQSRIRRIIKFFEGRVSL